MGTDLPDAEQLSNALEPQNWSWKHAPVCLLRREQCLAIMLHQWRSLEDTEGEGYNVLGGKAMNIAIDGLKRGTTALSDACELYSTFYVYDGTTNSVHHPCPGDIP